MRHHKITHFELTSRLESGRSLDEVQAMLQHALDHDGHLPLGEHVYLKLKAGQPALEKDVETAAALLTYGTVAEDESEHLPESGEPGERLLLGYLQFLAQPQHAPPRLACEIMVHPHFRNLGIGSFLWKKMLELARHWHFKQLDLWSYHHQAVSPAAKFTRSIGAEAARTLYYMLCQPEPGAFEVQLPDDLRLRSFRPGIDDAEWLSLNHLIFAHHPENGGWTAADLELRFIQEWFNPADFLVLEDETGEMVGFHWTKIAPLPSSTLYASPAYVQASNANNISHTPTLIKPATLGEVYIVGLHPKMQGRGLGRIVTLLGMKHLVERGADQICLYVDADNYVAVKLYKALGYTVHHQDVCFRCVISDN